MIYKKLRNRILFFIILLTLALFFFINFTNYKEKEEVLYNVSIEKLLILTKLTRTYEHKQVALYKGRFKNLNNNSKLKNVIKSRDLNYIRIYSRNLYKSYKKFTPNLDHFNVYDKKGIYLYNSEKRVRSTKVYAKNNLVLKESMKQKKLITGYVLLNESVYYYSMISPIKKHKKIIGYIEFGLKADNLFKIISKAGRFKYALYFNDDSSIGERKITLPTAANSKLFTDLKIDQKFIYEYANNNKVLEYKEKYYLFHQFDIERPFEPNFAQVLMATDVTKYIKENQETSIKSLLISFGILLFVYFLIYILFTKLINVLLKEEGELAIKRGQMQVIMDNSNNLITLFEKGKLVVANNTLLSFTEFPNLEELLKKHTNLSDVFEMNEATFSAPDSHGNIEWIHELSQLSEEKRVVAIKNKRFGLNYFSVKTKVIPSQPNTIIVIFSNISTLFKKSKKDEYMAYHDNLTDIYNRQYFNQSISKGIFEATNNHKLSSLLMLDIDFFKKVNDTYGHQVGDDVLIKFAQTISQNIRTNDIFARWGGEEFVLLLCSTNIETAKKVAQNLVQIISEVDFPGVGQITCSIGISEFRKNDDQETWMTRADEALYKAKENGRNRVEAIE